jgi:uncharacterized membrane protein YraQ (UPF0718 family)
MNSPSSDSASGHHDHPLPKNGKKALAAQMLFVLFAFSLVAFFRDRPQFHTLGIIFVSIVLEAFPFMLLGTLIGGFIEVFIPQETITRFLPERRWWAVFVAAALGVIFPVCECAIVPVVRRLIKKGVPLSAAIAFLLGGPIVNPLAAASTAVAYFADWAVVLHRMVLGYFIAVAVGLLMNAIFSKAKAVRKAVFSDQNPINCGALCVDCKPTPFADKINLAVSHAASDFFDIGRFLVIGAFFAAVTQALIPRQIFAAVTDAPALSILIMMLMAIALNLCSEADAFVAASFRSTPVPLTAQMAFMVLGPMLDIKLILMYFNVFRLHAILMLAALVFSMVFLSLVLL